MFEAGFSKELEIVFTEDPTGTALFVVSVTNSVVADSMHDLESQKVTVLTCSEVNSDIPVSKLITEAT